MTEIKPIVVYTADCIGNAANCQYPNEVKITDEVSAKQAFSTDMVCARYKNNYRSTANFEVANALPGDCDNDHSEIASEWITPEDIADLFAECFFQKENSPFSGKIHCADCGGIFGAKTWHSTDRYRRVIWQCNDKFKGEHKCETPHLTEERLKELFLSALGAYLSDRETVIVRLRDTQRVLTDTDFIDEDIRSLEENLTTITGKLRLCITENAANTVTEETYRTTHAELCSRFEETEAKLAALQRQRDKMKADAIAIGGMMFELGELDTLPVDFDEKLWHGTIDHVTVHADERVVFRFKDGKEIVTRL